MQPPVPLVPSLLGHVRPAFKETLKTLHPNLFFRKSESELYRLNIIVGWALPAVLFLAGAAHYT